MSNIVGRRAIQNIILTQLSIERRLNWGRLTPNYSKLVEDWAYNSIVIHHSGNSGKDDPIDVERHHMAINKYDDVGYHYLVGKTGKLYEGREIVYKGSHVKLSNAGKIGILMMGDFDHQWWDIDDDLSAQQLQALERLIKLLKTHFPISKLGGHKEVLKGQDYSCPGSELLPVISTLRKRHALSAP